MDFDSNRFAEARHFVSRFLPAHLVRENLGAGNKKWCNLTDDWLRMGPVSVERFCLRATCGQAAAGDSDVT